MPSRYGARYAYGHKIENDRHLVVSGGLGCSIAPVRIGCPRDRRHRSGRGVTVPLALPSAAVPSHIAAHGLTPEKAQRPRAPDARQGSEARGRAARAASCGAAQSGARRTAAGFEEAPQAAYDASARSPASTTRRTREIRARRGACERCVGAQATIDSLDATAAARRSQSARDRSPGRRIGPSDRRRAKAASNSISFPIISRRATSRRRSTNWSTGIEAQERDQVLLGVTGSGKTFTMAQVIERTQRPALMLAPNKTLGRAALRRVQELLSRTTPSNISCPITITTSPKPMCRAPTPISRRNPRSTSRSTACATPPRARCWSATTSSSSPRSPASTASARSKPTRR